MTTTLSATYDSLVTLDSPADNPTTITWAAILQAGMEATIAGLTVTNAGEVLNGSNGIGIILDLGGSITNVNGGTISAYYGIKDLYGSLAVVNSGSIGGNNTGIYALAANGTQPFSVGASTLAQSPAFKASFRARYQWDDNQYLPYVQLMVTHSSHTLPSRKK